MTEVRGRISSYEFTSKESKAAVVDLNPQSPDNDVTVGIYGRCHSLNCLDLVERMLLSEIESHLRQITRRLVSRKVTLFQKMNAPSLPRLVISRDRTINP